MSDMLEPGFMLGNGLAFMDLPGGAVKITIEENGARRELAIVDADGWASLVSSVSARGETAETYEKAKAFHLGTP